MTDWQHGYVTDVPYTFGYYREFAPSWLDWVALLRGAEPPTGNRRVLELGCGQGLGLCVLAAANPDYDFVGVDFNPEHIAHARHLARRCELTNVAFHEGDFIALADAPELPWGECDYLVAHGILSWVNMAVRQGIFRLAGRCLAPGGLAYFSYNALPGWLVSHPVQHLMRQLADRSGVNAASFETALRTLQLLKDANAKVFSALPGLDERLERLQKHPKDQVNYLYHEYFNGAWSLFYVTQVAEEAALGKLQYLGSANLPDNYDALLPAPMLEVLNAAPDGILRELYKDLLINQSFRRDVFVRGKAPVWSGEQAALLGERAVTTLQAPEKVDLTFQTSLGEVTGHETIYRPLLAAMHRAPIQIRELARQFPTLNFNALLQALSLLVHQGAVGFALPEAKVEVAQRFNRNLAQLIGRGAPYRFVALPGVGSALALDELQGLAIDATCAGAPRTLDGLAEAVGQRLQGLNRALVKDSQPLAFGAPTVKELRQRLPSYLEATLPLLKRLGAVA